MPHEHIPLTQAPNNEIGPLCIPCNKRMTFGEAMVHNERYICWDCYIKETGNKSATSESTNEGPFYK